jgi:signal transduction histidine kinase
MLEKNWIPSEQKRSEYYVGMRQESERLTRLIENVLDFSRLQGGKNHYHFQAGDLNACIEQAVTMMEPYAQQAGFTIERAFTPLDETAFDRDAVTQIVINLIDNAVKYATGGADRRIIVRTRRGDGHVLIEVEDHGPGLAHRQREKIFEQFYRGPDRHQQITTGVGLGLALVKKFALAHHGYVDVKNAQPSGAIFRVGLAATN